MKIIHIFQELKFSGAEKMYVEAAPIFQKKGCELIAIATGENVGEFAPQFVEAGYRIWHFPMPELYKQPFRFIRYFLQFYFFLKEQKPAVLHIHKMGKFWWYALCAKMNGVKAVRTIHNIFVNSKKIYWLKYWFERWSADKIFGLIFHSIGDSVQKNELRYFNKTVKIYNWYGSDFSPATEDEKRAIKLKLNISIEQYVIISIGGCSKIKNHHDIIRCLSLLPYNMNYLYIHIGTGITEKDERTLAEINGVLGNILFVGNTLNVRDYLIASDLFIMTSEIEGLSIATIEAQACGIPALVYNNPGVRDVIENNFNGLVISPNFQSLAKKIEYLYQNKEKAIEMGRNAILYGKENFEMEKNALKIIDLYKI